MAKVFYDRSGKAHTIGEKKKGEAAEESPAKGRFGASQGRAEPRKHEKKSNEHSKKASFVRNEDRSSSRNEGKPRFERGERTESGERKNFAAKPARTNERPRPGSKKTTKSHSKEGRRFERPHDRNGERPERGEAPGKGHYGRGGKKDANGRRGGKENRRGDRDGKKGGYRPPREGKPRPKREPDPSWIRLKGVVDKNKRGSGFLVFDRRDIEDLYIPKYYLDSLFHGDRVQVFVSEEGDIEDIQVLEHRFREIFGRVTFNDRDPENRGKKKVKAAARTGFLVYERKKAKEEVYLPFLPPEIEEGDWVKAEVNFGENGAVSAKITERIGPDLPAIFDIQMVAGEYNLKEHHTFDAVKQAESYKLEIPGKDEAGRTDLRNLPFMTIDGERARDFDDAVYVENLGSKGYRLWVAIADVSHYVKTGTPLDDEAYARATSVYFPERAFHMLPRALSEELCSLKPKVPRLSMAASIDYSKDGVKGEIKIFNAIIESRRRATYTEIEAEKADPKHADMFALYRLLKIARHARGSIDFDFPEAEIILDEKTGEPSDIVVRERNDAHRLIEEFMIAANESVTEWMLERKLPFIYRIHEEPSPEAMMKFIKLSRNMGVGLASKGGVPRPKVLAEFIHQLKGHAAEPVLATGLLRSMRQAIYSATHGEHYGLASEAYTHFTSPIRRYPDLIVHRLLRAALLREEEGKAHPQGKAMEAEQDKLEEMAEHCSYRERIASDAERESIRFKQIRLLGKHLGEEFEGKVNGLTDKGMFVQLWHPYCEGMVPVETMKDDWYEFQEERMQMIGRKTRKTFTIGQKMNIRVVSVDLDSRRVEFELK